MAGLNLCGHHHDPYDELPYESHPIEWSAPERLALASLLHGGPRTPLSGYRVLELGCGDGANLIPLAFYRQHSTFVGIDGARSQINIAEARRASLGLTNLTFIHSDILRSAERISGPFDYIIAHGVFSWIPAPVRDALLELCTGSLCDQGLLYLNYNTRPGWNIRGMVRDFLLSQTDGGGTLRQRALLAQEVSAKIATAMGDNPAPYATLIANEFRFVCENGSSYVAHEYLSADNHPYWRSEFLALAQAYDLSYVADADFYIQSRTVPASLEAYLRVAQIAGRGPEDTIDLLCYRQLHSPILTRGPLCRQPASVEEFSDLMVASCLAPNGGGSENRFLHPSGFEVEAKDSGMKAALSRLSQTWPAGLRVGQLFTDVAAVQKDLLLLHRNQLIELRCTASGSAQSASDLMTGLKGYNGQYLITPLHNRIGYPAAAA